VGGGGTQLSEIITGNKQLVKQDTFQILISKCVVSINDIRKNRGDNPIQDSPVNESAIRLFNENTTPDLDHNSGVLLWSADIASPVQIIADPIQPLYLMITGLKVELHSVA
jgi:hypothetical protein